MLFGTMPVEMKSPITGEMVPTTWDQDKEMVRYEEAAATDYSLGAHIPPAQWRLP
ncbi:hypothetical protein J2847_004095 [Azospirillum agricola]|nr:hypothetical protein [Azospirillum agricola]